MFFARSRECHNGTMQNNVQTLTDNRKEGIYAKKITKENVPKLMIVSSAYARQVIIIEHHADHLKNSKQIVKDGTSNTNKGLTEAFQKRKK